MLRPYLRLPCADRGHHYFLVSIIFSAASPNPHPAVHFSPAGSFITQPPSILRYLRPLSSAPLSRSYITPTLLISPPISAPCRPVSHYVHSQTPVSSSALLHISSSKGSFIKFEFLARRDGDYLVSKRGEIDWRQGVDDRIKGGDNGDAKRHFIPHLISTGNEIYSGVDVDVVPAWTWPCVTLCFCTFQECFLIDLIPKLNIKTPL